MVTLRGASCTVGECVSDGEGETDPGDEHQYSEEEDDKECEPDDSSPLLVLFDVETTGLSIYADHINRYWSQSASPCITHYSNILQSGEDSNILQSGEDRTDYFCHW